MLPEIGQHVIVDHEIHFDHPPAGRLLPDAHVAFRGVFLRVAGKGLPRIQHPPEPADVEPAGASRTDRSRDAFVRLDAAAAVHRPPGVGVFQLARTVRPLGVLIAQRVKLVLVEGLVPRPLNEPAARRVVVRRRERKAGVAVNPIHGLDERFSERGFAHHIRAIVILQRAGDDLRCARAAAVRDHHDRDVQELAVLGRPIILIRV